MEWREPCGAAPPTGGFAAPLADCLPDGQGDRAGQPCGAVFLQGLAARAEGRCWFELSYFDTITVSDHCRKLISYSGKSDLKSQKIADYD